MEKGALSQTRSTIAKTPPYNPRISSGTSIREETPLETRPCQYHDSTLPSVIAQLREVRLELWKMKTSGEPLKIKEHVYNRLADIIQHIEEAEVEKEQTTAQPSTEVDQRLSDVEKNIQNMEQAMHRMSEMVTETFQTMGQYFKEAKALAPVEQSQTYAQAAAIQANQRPATITNEQQNMKERTHQQRDKLRKLRQETEIVLTTTGMSDEDKGKVKNTEYNEIKETCQKAIEQSNILGEKPKVLGVNKLANGIRLQFKTKEEVEKAKTVDWNPAYHNLTLHKPKYGMVIHGVPKTALQFEEDQTKAIKEFEEANEELGIKVVQIKPLRRYPKPNRRNHSIIIFTEDASIANRCIDNNVMINYQIFAAERYVPQTQIMQCLNCQDYGHFAAQCKKQVTCGRCAKNHTTNECTEQELRCTHCHGSHQAWHHTCPRRQQESDQLDQRRLLQESPYFSI